MYDPLVGRWLSEDPITFLGDSSNLPRYVGNNPSSSIDPSGLEAIAIGVEGNDYGNWSTLQDNQNLGDNNLNLNDRERLCV